VSDTIDGPSRTSAEARNSPSTERSRDCHRTPPRDGAAPRPGKRPAARRAPTLFQEEWWLQAAAGADLQRVAVEWGGVEVASLDFVIERSHGIRELKMPPYTRTLGPVLTLPPGQPSQAMSHAFRATRDLIAKLPEHDRFRQVFDPDDVSAFAFSMSGFDVAAAYTFRIPKGTDPEVLWSRMEGRRRKLITERGRDLRIESHGSLDRFEAMAGRERSEGINDHDFPALRRIFAAAQARDQATILTAVNGAGRDVVNAIIVRDGSTAYFWLATRDWKTAGRGAKSLVAWQAVKQALEQGLAFDFDSYASLSGARFVSTFGVPPVVRPVVTRQSPVAGLVSAVKAALGPLAAWLGRGDSAVRAF
jgi:Acetyltransferase (GNAT) domain